MTPLLALAFLALARAAYIEVPNTRIHDDFHIDPTWTSSMFAKYGLTKPQFDDFTTWGKSIGVEDPAVLSHLHSYYDQPSLVFFQDPTGRVFSYYAHEGLDKPISIPEARSALYGMYGASDRMAINFHPEHMLGHYKTILPGHFFEPVNNIGLHRFLNDMPNEEFARWTQMYSNKFKPRPQHSLKDLWNSYEEEDYPIMYKEPVALDINKKYLSEGVVPYAHVMPFTGFSDVSAAMPFEYGRSGIVPSSSHLVSAMPFTGFSDATIPFGYGSSSIIPRASHLVSGMPFTGFSDSATAIPFGYGRSGVVPRASHLVSGMPFTGFSDASVALPFGYGRSSIVPAASHFVSGMPFTGYRSGYGVSPAVKSPAYHLVKADMPYFTAAPAAGFVDSAASAYPLVKTAAPLIAAETSPLTAAGFTPVHAYAAAPPATHYVAAPVHATTPLFTTAYPFAKAGVPCVNCLASEHAFSPAAGFHAGAGVIPLVKTYGDVSLTPYSSAEAYKSAFPVLSADPAMSFAANPAIVKAYPVTYGFDGIPFKQ